MDVGAISAGVGVLGKRALWARIAGLDEAEKATDADVLDLLALAPVILESYTGEFVAELKEGNVVWKDFEFILWELGEKVRQILKHHRPLRKSAAIWKSIRGICVENRFGKGRESLVMLLGQYGGRTQEQTLARLLKDPEVAGHALYSLRLLKSPVGAFAAREFLSHPQPWIRKEARKYLDKLGVATQPNPSLQRSRFARR